MYEENTTVTSETTRSHQQSMVVVVDRDGNRWICDCDVDPEGDLEAQGCWNYEKTSGQNQRNQ